MSDALAQTHDPVAVLRATCRRDDPEIAFGAAYCKIGHLFFATTDETGFTIKATRGSDKETAVSVGEMVACFLYRTEPFKAYKDFCTAQGIGPLNFMARRELNKFLVGTEVDHPSYAKRAVRSFATDPTGRAEEMAEEAPRTRMFDFSDTPAAALGGDTRLPPVPAVRARPLAPAVAAAETEAFAFPHGFRLAERGAAPPQAAPRFRRPALFDADAVSLARLTVSSMRHGQAVHTQRQARFPIILVPSVNLAYQNPLVAVTVANARAFLLEKRLDPASGEADGAAPDASAAVFLEYEAPARRGAGKRGVRFRLVDDPYRLSVDEWRNSVCAVICSGNPHEFNTPNNPWADRMERLFKATAGVYFVPLGMRSPQAKAAQASLVKWGARLINVQPGAAFVNGAAVEAFWRRVMEVTRARFPHLLD